MNEHKATLQEIIKKFGQESQTIKAIEEMSELVVELTKRLNGSESNRSQLLGELADVQVMIWQLVIIYSSEERFDRRINAKLQRTKERYGL
jgi:NTP pyrophosphatase (non-canonical NTP hydrolase)